jgi:hypothetical protein
MKTRKKGRAEKVAKMLVKMALDGMDGLPVEEKERRLTSFCADASDRLGKHPNTSGSARSAQGRLVARGRA